MSILFIVAENGFRDEEYFEPKQILEDADFVCEVASTNDIYAKGKLGAIIMPTVSLDLIDLDDYIAIILVGGPGALEMGEDIRVESIIREAFSKNKLICAICIAPKILAKYGLLKDRTVTCWNCETELKNFDLNYVNQSVVIDESKEPVIITANNADDAIDFGHEILSYLTKK